MKIYVTKQTQDRYNIKLNAHDDSNGDKNEELLTWSAKLFYFEGKKSIQFVNFASKLTLMMFNVKKPQLKNLDDMLEKLLVELYSNDASMVNEIEMLFAKSGTVEF